MSKHRGLDTRVVVINETDISILRLFKLYEKEIGSVKETEIELIIFFEGGMRVIDQHANVVVETSNVSRILKDAP